MAQARIALRHLACLALFLGLAGCFKSETPLIEKAQAKYPFQALKFKTEDGNASLKREGDFYVYREEDREIEKTTDHRPILFYEIEENLYAIQSAADDRELNYLFAKRDGDKITVENDCQGVSAEALKTMNIQTSDERSSFLFSCNIKDLDTLIRLGKSPALWSGESITLQIISME